MNLPDWHAYGISLYLYYYCTIFYNVDKRQYNPCWKFWGCFPFELERICSLTTTKNKTQESIFACMQTSQRPLPEVSILVSLRQPVQVVCYINELLAVPVYLICVLPSCDLGCYCQVRSGHRCHPLHSLYSCDNKYLHLRCSADGSCFVLCHSWNRKKEISSHPFSPSYLIFLSLSLLLGKQFSLQKVYKN